MVLRFRYSMWDGTQEVPPLEADEVLDNLTDDLMNFGDLQHFAALHWKDAAEITLLGVAPVTCQVLITLTVPGDGPSRRGAIVASRVTGAGETT